jgi:SPP1 gp7 family putative phage head morphogenesis protein
MRYSLATLWRRTRKPRRREVVLRSIVAPATLAGDLYAAGYRDVIQAWTAAVEPIVAAYERTLSELTQDSPEEVGAQVSAVEATIAGLLVTVRQRLARWAALLEQFQRGKWRGAVLSATGVDLTTLIGPADMRIPMSAAVERNVGLIASVSEQTRARIGERVFAGLQRRAPAREVAAEIREAVGMGRRRALLIASDQTQKLASELNRERAREAGLDFYQWHHSFKLHPRPAHVARDGKRFEYGQPAGDEPGMAIHCGCTARAVLSLEPDGF